MSAAHSSIVHTSSVRRRDGTRMTSPCRVKLERSCGERERLGERRSAWSADVGRRGCRKCQALERRKRCCCRSPEQGIDRRLRIEQRKHRHPCDRGERKHRDADDCDNFDARGHHRHLTTFRVSTPTGPASDKTGLRLLGRVAPMYNGHMKRYSVAEARARFSDLLDAAEQGEPAVIERRGIRFVIRPEAQPTARRSAKDDRVCRSRRRSRALDLGLDRKRDSNSKADGRASDPARHQRAHLAASAGSPDETAREERYVIRVTRKPPGIADSRRGRPVAAAFGIRCRPACR